MSENPVAESFDLKDLLLSFCSAISEKADPDKPDNSSEMIKNIQHDVIDLADQNKDLIIDDASKLYLAISVLILATYRNSSSMIKDSETRIDVLQKAIEDYFKTGIRDYIKVRFDVDYNKPEEAYSKVMDNFLTRGKKYLGDAFSYGIDSKSSDKVVFRVSKCFFLNFFKRNNAQEATKIMCVLDSVWAREFNEGAYNILFDRPTLMSDGDDICRFQFRKSEAGLKS